MTDARRLRLIPAIDEMPPVVRFAETLPGRCLLVVIFALGLRLHDVGAWRELSIAFGVLSIWPDRRRLLVALATAYFWLGHMPVRWDSLRRMADSHGVSIAWGIIEPTAIVAALAVCAGLLGLVRSESGRRWLHRPIAALLTAYTLLLVGIGNAPMSEALRCHLLAFVLVFQNLIWFLGYAMIHREPGVHPLIQVGHLLPFWQSAIASTTTPFAKGGAYLGKIEAKNPAELAVCQLKALKLLLWAGVLILVQWLFREIVFASPGGPLESLGWTFALGVPTLGEALAAHASGEPLVWWARASSLVAYFLNDLLGLSIWGHKIVACCRMAGFNALRNTYRPLQSSSIADFWNRYYFYYKELLLDFFFYPAFLRYFKRRPVLRRLFATLCAATLGNTLFHVLRELPRAIEGGVWALLYEKRGFALYALVLGLGIGVSQLRGRRGRAPVAAWRTSFGAPAAVAGFYCMLSVLLVRSEATVIERITYLLGLIGLG